MNFIPIIGPIIEAISSYVKHKQEITKIEREGEVKIKQAAVDHAHERATQGEANEAAWDLAQVNNSGWKDEFLTIVLSIPLIGCFIPGMDGYVKQGFAVLETTPVWYQAAVGVMIAAAFGMKQYAKYLETKAS